MKEALHVISLNEKNNLPYAGPVITANEHLKDYYLFNLSGGRKKVKILLPDILLVRAIKGGHADKLLYLKGNIMYIIRGHGLDELIKLTGFLLQVNKQDLVSPVAIHYLDEDAIYLNNVTDNGKPIYLTLNRTYRKAFFAFFHYPNKR